MGRPNFQRLAELGQLPDYVKPTFDEAIAQINAQKKEKAREVKEEAKESERDVKESKLMKKQKKGKKVFVDTLSN